MGRRIEVRLAQLAIDEVVEVGFQARVSQFVTHGAGIVNTALLAADNAPVASSTSATAVASPFGVVYQGRSAGTPVPGARVSLFADSSNGALVPLNNGADAGFEPNLDNSNPFGTDAAGRWSFVLSAPQLGTPQSPARYFLNVTAPGYRSRLIETTITPDGAGLFALSVRALDGQPVARGGSFETTEEQVDILRLAAYALNVPMFENSSLEITKSADRPSVEVGDTVTYRVELRNATPAALNEAVVRDQLPPSFHYAEGTALLESPPAPARSIEPEVASDGLLIFRIGRVEAGARVALTYRIRVGANAPEGEQFNTASAAGTLSNGERVSAPRARASVRVRRGLFSSQQVLLGRVYSDANFNGQFDKDERGVPGVRLYLNNGQSVITDSEGLYNFPVVNEGAQVLSLDPVTLPPRLRARRHLAPRRAELDAPAPHASRRRRAAPSELRAPRARHRLGALRQFRVEEQSHSRRRLEVDSAARSSARSSAGPNSKPAAEAGSGEAKPGAPLASGTYELVTEETLEPVAAGEVRVLSPRPDEAVAGAALEIEARTNAAWTVSVEVGGQRVPDSKIGEKRIDRKNDLATFTFVGLGVAPGPNRIRVTAVGPDGAAGKTVELTAYGRGPAKRLEILTDKAELSAGGRDTTTVRVRAFDQWGHPAADGSVALAVSAGRLLRVDEVATDGTRNGKSVERAAEAALKQNDRLTQSGSLTQSGTLNQSEVDVPGGSGATTSEQIVPLVGGEGRVDARLGQRAGLGRHTRDDRRGRGRASGERSPPKSAPAILVGLGEVTIGAAAPELSGAASDATVRSRLAFFYRGQLFGSNLLTLAYDSNRPINRTGGRDRLFQFDPLDRAYPLFGDSSTRFEDAQTNSKLYARLDRGRSYFLFGDFETENRHSGLASYTRKLTGVKLHLENSKGDYVSVTGARPDTAFARDVFPGGALGFARLSHAEVLPGSETLVIEVRDRRNPETIISREALIRSVDYNLDAATGEVFFLRPISSFDFSFNLVQVVATYEYAAQGMSQAVYTARAYKHFEGLGLKLGLSLVDQRQGDFGSFVLGGVDAEKSLPRGGRVRAEWATSRGRVVVGRQRLLRQQRRGRPPRRQRLPHRGGTAARLPRDDRARVVRARRRRLPQPLRPDGHAGLAARRRLGRDEGLQDGARALLLHRRAQPDGERRQLRDRPPRSSGRRTSASACARSSATTSATSRTRSRVARPTRTSSRSAPSTRRPTSSSSPPSASRTSARPTRPTRTRRRSRPPTSGTSTPSSSSRSASPPRPSLPSATSPGRASPRRARATRRPSASRPSSDASPTSTRVTRSRTASAAPTASPSSASRTGCRSIKNWRSTSATSAASTSRARARTSTPRTSASRGSPSRASARRGATKCATAAAQAPSSRSARPAASSTT